MELKLLLANEEVLFYNLVMLSGGQKARLALARAIYSDSDIYILDDPLAAVDSGVGRKLFDNAIQKILLSDTPIGNYRHSKAAIVLISHQLQYIKKCDLICVLDYGSCILSNSFQEAIEKSNQYSETYKIFVSTMVQFLEQENVIEDSIDTVDLKIIRNISFKDVGGTLLTKELITTEGSVTWGTFIQYFRSGVSIFSLVLVAFVMVLGQAASIGTDYFLSLWSNQSAATQLSNGSFNVAVWSGLVFATLIVSISRAEYFFYLCINCAKALHNKMLDGVTNAAIHFFETNPHGRLLKYFQLI